jgi:cytochrome bd-type quinol oxidase subunit 1
MDALVVHRIQFAFTLTFHYLFPQLTMGMGLLIVILKSSPFALEISTTMKRRAFGRGFLE